MMRTIMAKTQNDSSFSFSRRYLKKKPSTNGIGEENDIGNIANDNDEEIILSSLRDYSSDSGAIVLSPQLPPPPPPRRQSAVSKLLMTLFSHSKQPRRKQLGTRVVGTLFGHRRGHVHFAFQEDPSHAPAFLIELAMPTSVLVREMASGLVRIALECGGGDAGVGGGRRPAAALIEEPVWRTYCNGRKCGFASRAECGPDEWKVLRAVGPISMGAGVLPGCGGGGGGDDEGEVMYMRARFERVVGSKDSESFYMMNPDASGGPELSIYLLRT